MELVDALDEFDNPWGFTPQFIPLGPRHFRKANELIEKISVNNGFHLFSEFFSGLKALKKASSVMTEKRPFFIRFKS